MTTYVVVMRVNEAQMPVARKDMAINYHAIVLVNATSVTEAHDKAITVFPPDMIGRATISVNSCSAMERAIVDSLWDDHVGHTQLKGMVDQLLEDPSK